MVKWTKFIEVAEAPPDLEPNEAEIPTVDHIYIAPGYKLYHIVSDFSHIIAPITVPFKCDTTFRDIKNEVARVLNIEQQRQELYYAGIPMGDDWNVLDLPIDCDTFHVRVLPKKTAQEEYGELSEQDKLIDGEELPAMIRHQMELERLGRWSLSASQRGDNEQAETTQDNHADAMMQTAYIESEYAIMHDRIVAQLHAKWSELRILAQKDAVRRKIQICEAEEACLELLMTRNAKARAELKNASHAMQEELNTDQEAYAAQAKLDALATTFKDEFDGVDMSTIAADQEQILRDKKIARLQKEGDETRAVRHFESDMWTFCYIVVIFSIVVFTAKGSPQDAYYFLRSVKQGLEGQLFRQVSDQGTMWKYLSDECIPQIARFSRYSGAEISPYDLGYYRDYNRVVGAIRIRQIRGGWQECEHLPDNLRIFPCYNSNDYSAQLNKLTHVIGSDEPMHSYDFKSSTGADSFSGKLGSYSGSGYVVDLDATQPLETITKVKELQAEGWTDHLTRAMFVEINMYNANINRWTSVRLLFEMPLTGGVRANAYYGVVKMFRYANDMDYYILSFECCFMALMLNYLSVQVRKFQMYGFKAYITNFWTCYDLANFGTLFAVVGMRMYSMITLMDMDIVNVPSWQFINLFDLSQIMTQEQNVNSVNSLLMYIRAFKFFQLSPRMKQFIDTWDKAFMNLVAFWTMMLIILLSYAAAGYVLFGTKLSNFKTYGECILTIVQYMVASYNLDEMEEKSGLVGVLFIVGFIMSIYFVLMNIPMIVLGEAYDFQMNLISAGTKRDLPTDVRQDLYNRLENCLPCIKTARLAREAKEEHELRIQAGIIIDDFQRLEMMVLIQKITEKIGADAVANLWEENFDDEIDFESDILTTDWRKMCLLMRAQNAKSSASIDKFH